MNKKFTKLMAALALLTFLAVPMGMWGQSSSIEINTTNSGVTGSYQDKEFDVNDITFKFTQWMKNNNIQAKKSTANSLYNIDAIPGTITSIVVVQTGTARAITIYGGTSEKPTNQITSPSTSATMTFDFTGNTYNYFSLTTPGNACYFDKITINYTPSGGTPTHVLSSEVTPTGTGTVALSKTLLEEGETATATATANAHYTFTSWSIAGEGATLSSTTTNPTTVTMGTANATITATFTEDPKYNITYNPNYEGSTDEPVVVSDYAGQTMTIADYSTFSRTGFILTSWNTQADGTGTSYNAGDSYTMTSTGLTLYAQWEVSYETVDVLNLAFTGISGGSGYGNWSGKEGTSGAVYAGNSGGGSSTSNPSIQLRTTGSNSGIVSTTSGGKVTKVEVTWNSSTASGRKLDIYGKNSAYSAATDLYGNNAGTLIGSITCGNNNPTVLTISGNYEYIGLRSNNNAMYLDEIKITWSAAPSTDPTITTDDVEIAYDATSGSIMGEIVNYVEGTVSAATDADWISNFTYDQADEIFEVDFAATVNPSAVARTANVTLTFTYGNNETTTKNVTVSQTGNPNGPGTQNNPYTVAQAIDAIDNNGNVTNVYATGVVSQVTYFSQNNHYITYYISADGSTTGDQLQAYRGKGINGADFSSIDDIQVGDVVVIKGNLMYYSQSSTYEFAENNQLVSLVRPAQYTLTNAMTNVAEYHVFVGDDEIEFDNNNQAQVRAGATVYVSLTMEDCYALTSLTVNGSTTGVTEIEPGVYYSFVMPEGDATIGVSATQATQYTLTVVGLSNVTYTDMLAGVGSEEVTLTNNQATLCEGINVDIVGLSANAGLSLQSVTLNDGTTTTTLELEYGVYHFNMPSSNATLTFTTHEVATFTYTKVTSVTPGKHYIIVTASDDSHGKYHAMGGNNSTGSNPYMNPVEVNVDNNTVTVAENEGVAEILIDVTGSKYTLHTSEGYLAGGDKKLDINGTVESTWGISFDDDQAVITWTSGNTNYAIQYNSSSPRFACYSSSQAKVCLYEKNEPAHTLTITAHTDNGGWYLIASPVTVDPVDAGMITDNNTGDGLTPATSTYELYAFDNSEESEWRNYRSNQFNLEPGKGYLYASKNGGNFTLIGTPYSGDGEITLSGSSNTGGLANWNLIGNPYPVEAVISCDYYAMNDDGTDVEAKADDVNVAAMQGVFVVYDATTNPFVLFEPATEASTAPVGDDKFILNVSQNRGNVIDRAIVRMGESRQLPKFQLFENSTKLYIPQNGKDYAIVSTEAQGEMPVNFRAAENGTYTLSIDIENVEMNYLHLIDNMTGMDVDLLQTPSYTFNATTRDYESRFRLVFAANNNNEDGPSTGSGTFAFYSNGSWIINNAGEATLQVIDLTGRILISETVNGSVSKTINATPGVYMLRLINGENVNVQKIVVR